MKALIYVAALSAFTSLTPFAYAGGPDLAFDSRDIEIQALQDRAGPSFTRPLVVTPITPTLDPAYDARDHELMALGARVAKSTTGSVTATNDVGLAGSAPSSAWDPSLTGRDREVMALQKRAFGS